MPADSNRYLPKPNIASISLWIVIFPLEKPSFPLLLPVLSFFNFPASTALKTPLSLIWLSGDVRPNPKFGIGARGVAAVLECVLLPEEEGGEEEGEGDEREREVLLMCSENSFRCLSSVASQPLLFMEEQIIIKMINREKEKEGKRPPFFCNLTLTSELQHPLVASTSLATFVERQDQTYVLKVMRAKKRHHFQKQKYK